MRLFSIRFFISILCFWILSATVGRAQDFHDVMTQDQALALAYKENPQMRQARQKLAASKGRAFQAKSLPNPQAEISIGGLRKNETGQRNSDVSAYTIKQPLGTPGSQLLKWQISDREVGIEHSGLELAWGQVRTDVIQLYSRILFQEKSVELCRGNLQATRQFFVLVENRFQSGAASKSEVIRAKLEVLKSENDILSAQKNLNVSKGELNLVLGRKLDAPMELSETLEEIAFDGTYANFLARALASRADVRMADQQSAIAGKNLINAYLQAVLPEMSLGFERTIEDFENDASVLIEFSYPLWGFNQGKIKEARADREQRSIELEGLKQQIGLEVYEVFHEMELANKQINLNKKALDEADELLRQITLSYQDGDLSFMAFLESLKTVKETRLAFLEAVDHRHAAFARLQMAIQDTPIPGGEDEK